jgi:hypothetical protein
VELHVTQSDASSLHVVSYFDPVPEPTYLQVAQSLTTASVAQLRRTFFEQYIPPSPHLTEPELLPPPPSLPPEDDELAVHVPSGRIDEVVTPLSRSSSPPSSPLDPLLLAPAPGAAPFPPEHLLLAHSLS